MNRKKLIWKEGRRKEEGEESWVGEEEVSDGRRGKRDKATFVD